MGIATNNLQSFRPYHPGELIKEELECRGIRQKDFAKRFGLSYSALNDRICLVFRGGFGCQCRFACKNANGL